MASHARLPPILHDLVDLVTAGGYQIDRIMSGRPWVIHRSVDGLGFGVVAANDGHVLDDVVDDQGGVVSRSQARAGGVSKRQLDRHSHTGRWQRIFPGVYATFSGPVPWSSLLWAVVLRAGPGAVLSHDTAAELSGLIDRRSATIHVTVPWRRAPRPIPGVLIHRCDQIGSRSHPTRVPPQTRIEETVVDLTQSCDRMDDAIAWLARAVGSRLTTSERLRAALDGRPRLRWRRSLAAALGDVAGGSHSLMELRYLRTVERAHRLPRSERQVRRDGPGPTRYDDVRYRRFATRVELDGRAAHPEHERWRDMDRDNQAVAEGDRVLRYGFGEVSSVPCRIAAQVASVLRACGWKGRPRRCRRTDCAFP